MLAPLVLVLALFGIALLVVGERMGLPAALGVAVLQGILAVLLAATGFGSVTSRFERFCLARAGDGPAMVDILARSALMLVLLAVALPMEGGQLWLALSVGAGFFVGHWAQQGFVSGRIARGADLAAGMGAALALVLLLPRLVSSFAFATGYTVPQTALALALAAVAVLIPAGALAARRVQVVLLVLAMLVAGLPLMGLAGLSWMEAGDPLAFDTLMRMPSVGGDPLARPSPGLVGLALAAGYAVRGRGTLSARAAAGGLVLGGLFAGGLVVLGAFAQGWIETIIGTRLLGVAPQQWPAFVFDEEMRIWIRVCGAAAVDPVMAARGCGLPSAASVPGVGSLTFQASQNGIALARANGLPLLLGALWQTLPPMLAFAGALTLIHAAAVSVSESLLFRTINPTGLRSWRLAMARLSVAGVTIAAFWLYPRTLAWPQTLSVLVSGLMGLAILGAAVAAWTTRKEIKT